MTDAEIIQRAKETFVLETPTERLARELIGVAERAMNHRDELQGLLAPLRDAVLFARSQLLEEMRDTSELCVFAQWLSGLEFILWDAIEARNRVFPGSMGGEIDIGRLSDLSAKCGGWWIWDEESSAERFVTLAEWEAIRKARK